MNERLERIKENYKRGCMPIGEIKWMIEEIEVLNALADLHMALLDGAYERIKELEADGREDR